MSVEHDTKDHIRKVQAQLRRISHLLRIRGEVHDASKLEEPELSGYQGLSDAVAGLAYGSMAHRAAMLPFKEIIAHHYANNGHHPEHWPGGVNDMSLLDVIEMLCDWKAASEREQNNFAASVKTSIERFGIGHQMALILENTAKELGWIDGA